MDLLQWLEEWLRSECNGDWEHCYGVQIGSLDNPGWWIQIDIADTELEDKKFDEVWYNNGDEDWLICRINQGKFEGSGDLAKLKEIIKIFKEWVEA